VIFKLLEIISCTSAGNGFGFAFHLFHEVTDQDAWGTTSPFGIQFLCTQAECRLLYPPIAFPKGLGLSKSMHLGLRAKLFLTVHWSLKKFLLL